MAKQASTARFEITLELTIGILTYQRPDSLDRTLESLVTSGALDPADQLEQSACSTPYTVLEVLVVDNDRTPSAAAAVAAWAERHGLGPLIRHVHEPEPGLAAARNRALNEARAPILVFIDDDEVAEPGWPGGLVTVMARTGAAMVGGPVRTRFEHEPPDWVVDGGHFERPEAAHGTRAAWLRSGNLAIDLTQTEAAGLRFDQRFAFSGGEDVAFSRAAAELGLDLRWSAQGAVTEIVGPDRTTVRWVTRRARTTTAAYVRAQPASVRSRRWRLSMLARAGLRLGQGGATVALGAVTVHYGRVIAGMAQLHRGLGFLQGLLGRQGDNYR